MFEYFVHKKHGSISIMLSFLLIAVLSLSSTMMETARYRSTKMLLDELEQNATFSLLGCYDRDLYKNFGLLAMGPDIGEEQLRNYLDQNMNCLNSEMDLNGLDTMLAIEEVGVDKLYDLTQSEVFRAQVMEFSAYRAPVTLVSNMVDLEDMLKELSKKLNEALPLLDTFKKLAQCMQKIIDTFTKLKELIDEAETFEADAKNYRMAVEEYNDAVSDRNDYKENHTSDEEGYAEQLVSLNSTVSEKAAALKGKIATVKKSMGAYYNKYKEFKTAYDNALNAEVDALISGALYDANKIEDAGTKESTKKMLNEMKSGYDGAKDLCGSIVGQFDTSYEGFISSCQDSLTEQYNDLDESVENLSSIAIVETLAEGSTLIIVVRTVIGMLKVLTQMVDGWNKSIKQMSEMIKVMKIMQTGGLFEPEYNNILGNETWNSLPGVSNGGKLGDINNPYAAEDEKMVSDRLADTAKVAASLDYDIALLEPGAGPVEESALQIAMEQMKQAGDTFQEQCEKLGQATNILTILSALFNIIATLIAFLDSVLNLIHVFISCITSNLTRILYQKMWGAVYANEMFSNRTTDLGTDKRMNNTFFPNLSSFMLNVDNECFDMANAEYILGGTNIEIINQEVAFLEILAMRVLCNIPAIVSNETLWQVVEELCAIPFVGWIAAIIVVCVMFFLEAWADMIVMIYGDLDGKQEVDIIKMNGYFTLKGGKTDDMKGQADELQKKVDLSKDHAKVNLAKDTNTKVDLSKDSAEEDKDKEKDKDPLKWSYKDHMQIMLLLFVSNDKLYARCADLIQMQTQQMKKLGGDIKPFKLSDMNTYARVRVDAKYRPVLPVPVIPGLNDMGIPMESIHYSGY